MNHHYSKGIRILAIGLLVFLCVYFFIHHLTKKNPITIPTPSVIVQKPKEAETVDYIIQTGTTVAFNSVDLVARVEGYLDSIDFVDGSFINKGKNLFVIQPEPYLEKLKAAQAQVAGEKAAFVYAKTEYERQTRMYKQNATSLNNVEKWLAKTQEIQAGIDKAIADEQIAAINYSYTHIAAPFDGRIGRHLVDIGNLVGNGAATNLATIEQINPLYVYFNLNELDLIKLRAMAQEQGLQPNELDKIPVFISMQNQTKEYKATFNFVNTGLNASTGTMELRAVLDNKDYVFVPGLFVQVKLAISRPTKQLTIPDTAILYDQIGPYIYLVDNNNMVLLNRVTLGSVNQGRRAILKGIKAQDHIITSGLQNATPGNKVIPHEESI